MEGRVEVCIDGIWGTINNRGWTNQEAKLICSLFGFSNKGMVVLLFDSLVSSCKSTLSSPSTSCLHVSDKQILVIISLILSMILSLILSMRLIIVFT